MGHLLLCLRPSVHTHAHPPVTVQFLSATSSAQLVPQDWGPESTRRTGACGGSSGHGQWGWGDICSVCRTEPTLCTSSRAPHEWHPSVPMVLSSGMDKAQEHPDSIENRNLKTGQGTVLQGGLKKCHQENKPGLTCHQAHVPLGGEPPRGGRSQSASLRRIHPLPTNEARLAGLPS